MNNSTNVEKRKRAKSLDREANKKSDEILHERTLKKRKTNDSTQEASSSTSATLENAPSESVAEENKSYRLKCFSRKRKREAKSLAPEIIDILKLPSNSTTLASTAAIPNQCTSQPEVTEGPKRRRIRTKSATIPSSCGVSIEAFNHSNKNQRCNHQQGADSVEKKNTVSSSESNTSVIKKPELNIRSEDFSENPKLVTSDLIPLAKSMPKMNAPSPRIEQDSDIGKTSKLSTESEPRGSLRAFQRNLMKLNSERNIRNTVDDLLDMEILLNSNCCEYETELLGEPSGSLDKVANTLPNSSAPSLSSVEIKDAALKMESSEFENRPTSEQEEWMPISKPIIRCQSFPASQRKDQQTNFGSLDCVRNLSELFEKVCIERG